MDRAEDLRPGAASTADDDDDYVSVWNGAAHRAGRVAGLSGYTGRDSLAEIMVEQSRDPDDVDSHYRRSRVQAIERWRAAKRAEKLSTAIGGGEEVA